MLSFLKKIPGFGSGKWWQTLVASGFYSLVLLIILAILSPSAPTLTLDKIDPTNKSSVSLAGKTSPGKPVYLLQNNETIQSIKADSSGQFYFALNDLKDGNFTYTIESCHSEKKDKCWSENILVVVDQTPPTKPMVALPDKLPDTSEEPITIKGVSDPKTNILTTLQDKELPLIQTNDQGEFEVKTSLALGTNTISLKAIDEVGNESEPVTSSLEFKPSKYKTKVIRVIDGDTIKIEDDKVVRYIGIDTPETVHPSKPVQCYGQEASAKNKELVEGKEVMLEKDISETDKYGRLLRYIWLGEMLVNEYLVREGYAQSSTYPPDVKYQERFLEAQRLARKENKGLWGEVCQFTTSTQSTQSTYDSGVIVPTQTQFQPASQTAGSYTCNCSKTCPQMSSCAEAQYQLNVCGCSKRDADKDGIACDADCQ